MDRGGCQKQRNEHLYAQCDLYNRVRPANSIGDRSNQYWLYNGPFEHYDYRCLPILVALPGGGRRQLDRFEPFWQCLCRLGGFVAQYAIRIPIGGAMQQRRCNQQLVSNGSIHDTEQQQWVRQSDPHRLRGNGERQQHNLYHRLGRLLGQRHRREQL